MIRIFLFLLSIINFSIVAQDCFAESTINPYYVTLSYVDSKSSPPIPIISRSKTIYLLSLEPDIDIEHQVIVLVLKLRRPADGPDDPNRFDPTGHWHGYQKWIFAGRDFVNGIGKSIGGKERTVALADQKIEFQINVLTAEVKDYPPISGYASEDQQKIWSRLELGVSILGVR